MTTNISCPIWQTPAIALPNTRDGQEVDSARAGGRYFVGGTALALLTGLDEVKKVILTSWLVEQRRLGVSCPEILSTTLEEVTKRRAPTVHYRADAFLRYLGAKSDLLGTVVKIYALDNTEAPRTAYELLAWTGSRQISELITLAEYCKEEGWIEHRVTERAGQSQNTIHEFMLKPPGYARLGELDGINSGSTRAFVAMWFGGSMDTAYNDSIAVAVKDAGYVPIRIDRKDHNNRIDDEIIAEIRRSRFVVADFTADFDLTKDVDNKRPDKKGARGGVYYEAGFAHGLNIPVIFLCRADVINYLHFDIRQYNCLVWTDKGSGNEDKPPFSLTGLRQALANRISATIGDGPEKKSG